MTEEISVLSHPARVKLIGGNMDLKDNLLLQARDRGFLDEATLSEFPPFLFRAEISNDLLDSHFTRMHESTLRNYAADASIGVAFLKGHNHRELPIGYSLEAQYEIETGKQRVLSSFYTVSGLPETDDLIARMKTGLIRDVSVGFHGGSASCDICDRDFFDCPHFPGLQYEVKEGDTVRKQLATFTIKDARLSEVSAVFDGSTPEATVLKAERAIQTGDMTVKEHDALEHKYRVKLPAVRTVHAVPDIPVEEEGEKNTMFDDKQVGRLTEILVISGRVAESERDTLDAEKVLVHLDKLVARNKELEPQASDGRQYREDLVQDALTEGVRAMGNDFVKSDYEPMLRNAPVQLIKRMRDDWKKVAATAIPTGRSSHDDDHTPVVKGEVKARVPDSAYS